MFCLRISLTLAAIDEVKAHLLRALPHVKSSHRVEATGRGLGFQTYAALRAAVQEPGDLSVEVTWEPFVGYLKEHGFEADPSHLYQACGRVAVQRVLEKLPRLTILGFETGRLERSPDGTKETRDQYRERVKQRRQDLFDEYGVREFLLCLALLTRVRQTKDHQCFEQLLDQTRRRAIPLHLSAWAEARTDLRRQWSADRGSGPCRVYRASDTRYAQCPI